MYSGGTPVGHTNTNATTNTNTNTNTNSRYTGVTPAPPPGNTHTSPSEDYWAQVDLNGARQAVNLVNGVIVDGKHYLQSQM